MRSYVLRHGIFVMEVKKRSKVRISGRRRVGVSCWLSATKAPTFLNINNFHFASFFHGREAMSSFFCRRLMLMSLQPYVNGYVVTLWWTVSATLSAKASLMSKPWRKATKPKCNNPAATSPIELISIESLGTYGSGIKRAMSNVEGTNSLRMYRPSVLSTSLS